ncbi:MAG: RagB/SusD family nutrient uptake outer membrane protein [Tannerellaceae bacterium]|jgi:hypothetical protein|nr:RagB/SusD family nutrient uptake outer membrane protein [Tannerellaceae bacterium]
MKTRNIIPALLALITTLGSCDDMAFLERKDESLALTQDSVRTEQDLERLMLGAYNGMRANGFMNGIVAVAADLIADDTEYTGATFEWVQAQTHKMDLFNPIGRDMWNNTYRTINYANQAAFSPLADDILSGGSGGTALKADASFIRAIGHFHLVRHFGLPYSDETKDIKGRGVPIRSVGFVNIADVAVGELQRSTVDSVYAQVIADLRFAAENLPAGRQWNGGTATIDAANAMLAKVYFYKGDMAAVVDHAKNIVKDNGPYDLDADIAAKFAGAATKIPSKEVIFMLPSTATGDDSWGGIRERYNPSSGAVQYFPSDAAIAAFDRANDIRFATFFEEKNGRYNSIKYNYAHMDAIIIAYNELMLYYAEALAATNDTAAASKWLNRIEARAYGAAKTSAAEGKENIIAAIQKERRLELINQGERIHELKRLKKDVRGAGWNQSATLFQIPDNEQNGNPGIIPN